MGRLVVSCPVCGKSLNAKGRCPVCAPRASLVKIGPNPWIMFVWTVIAVVVILVVGVPLAAYLTSKSRIDEAARSATERLKPGIETKIKPDPQE